jgi:hypothetical protein
MIFDILICFFAVFVFLGFLQAFDIYKEYRDDIKVHASKPEKTIHKIILPIENNSSIEEMEMFFRTLHTMKTNDPLTQVVFEFHSDAGKIGIYLIANTEIFSLIRSSLETRFPGVNFITSEDPFTGFDTNWTSKPEKFIDFKSFDIKYATPIIDGTKVRADLLPSLSWRAIQNGSNPPTNDPINQLISNLEELQDGEYAVLQLILRAGNIDRAKYKKEFEKIRKQFLTNATQEGGNALTEEEKKILNEIQRKVTSVNFTSKIRFGYFQTAPDITPKIPWYFIPKSFLKQFDTPYQSFDVHTPWSYSELNMMPVLHYLNYFEPKKPSLELFEKPYTTLSESKERAMLNIMGSPNNREGYFRRKQQYVALLDRAFKYGSAVDSIDVESLACLFHFPTTNEKNSVTSKLQNLANDSAAQNPASWATPPANLPF